MKCIFVTNNNICILIKLAWIEILQSSKDSVDELLPCDVSNYCPCRGAQFMLRLSRPKIGMFWPSLPFYFFFRLFWPNFIFLTFANNFSYVSTISTQYKQCSIFFEPVQILFEFFGQNSICFDFLDCLDRYFYFYLFNSAYKCFEFLDQKTACFDCLGIFAK